MSRDITIKKFMTEWVEKDLDLCIGCNRCMEACPVSKEKFTIGELNHATQPEKQSLENQFPGNRRSIPSEIRDFAFNCVQCGRCVPVCPAGARRDYMVLFLKHKLLDERPPEYTNYLSMKGPFVSKSGMIKQKIYASVQKAKHRDHAKFMETVSSEKTGVLFYPGCYIYNNAAMKRTLKLLDHIGEPYEVLGGLNTCCGIPQLLQGDFDLADRCLDALHEKVMVSDPKIVITGCAECLEALLRIKAKHKTDFQVLSALEYLMEFVEKFPITKLRDSVTLHDSCRLTRRYHRGETTRQAISRFASLHEMEESGPATKCCYYWNFEHDPKNQQHREKRIESAKGVAGTMVCDCISCYEKYEKFNDNGIEVIDVLHLFEESLDHVGGKMESNNERTGVVGKRGEGK